MTDKLERIERAKAAMLPLVNEHMDPAMRDAWLTDLATAALAEREEIVTYLKACTPSREFHDSDFSQGVIRGFEICIAQIEEGHHLSTRQAPIEGSGE